MLRNHKRFLIPLVAVAIALLLATAIIGLATDDDFDYTANSKGSDIDKTISLDLSMQAYIVNLSGDVSETAPLQIKGDLIDLGYTRVLVDAIHVPESFSLQFDNIFTCGYKGIGESNHLKRLANLDPDIFFGSLGNADMLLDYEEGYMLIGYHNNVARIPPYYMVASTDPTKTTQEIIDHFDGYVEYVDRYISGELFGNRAPSTGVQETQPDLPRKS